MSFMERVSVTDEASNSVSLLMSHNDKARTSNLTQWGSGVT